MDSSAPGREENKTFDLTTDYFMRDKECYIYFVKHAQITDEFLEDYQALKRYHDQKGSVMVKLIDEEQCLKLQKHDLDKSIQLFAFDRFDSSIPAFKHISNMKTIYIIGSRLLAKTIGEKFVIPLGSHHIFNLFMQNSKICFASFTADKKERYRKLIEYMGGFCTNHLFLTTTHIVTEDVFSKKYMHGAREKMKIMHPSWIDESWKISQDSNSLIEHASDEDFSKKHKLKVFHNLVITSTGLANDDRTRIQVQIEKYGGSYSAVFKTLTAKVLILTIKDIENKKYKAAQDHNIHCLDPKWVRDSVKAGYAQNPNDYKIQKYSEPKSSTPTKDSNLTALKYFNGNDTMLSVIHDHTVAKDVSFDETGATRRTSSRASSVSSAKSPPKISNDQRNTLLKPAEAFKIPALPQRSSTPAQKENEDVVKILTPPRIELLSDGGGFSDESDIQILINKVICIFGYRDGIESMNCIKECEKLGASLVDLTYSKVVDYVITSAQYILNEEPKIKYKYFLNDVWLEESVEEGRCIDPPKFHHYALCNRMEKDQVLKGETFVCSNYSERKRPYIKSLIETLGGNLKETFSNNDPILICEVTEGRKFEAALTWKKTILRADWLLQCFLRKSRVNETNFLVGSSKPSEKNVTENDDIPCSQEIMEISIHRNQKSPTTSPNTPAKYANCQQDDDEEALSISKLCEDLPTPARELTVQILKENRRKKNEIMSPRAQKLKDLINTPGVNGRNIVNDVSSPAPPLPLCMQPSDRDYGLFENSSPYTQYYYKCKLEILDEQYVHKSNRKKRELRIDPSTPNYQDMKRDFFRRKLPDYQSPALNAQAASTSTAASPLVQRDNVESQTTMSKEASKFLNFGDSEFDEEPKRKSGETDEFSGLEELLIAAREDSAKKARASERMEYEAQRESAKKSFQQTSQNENKMLVDQQESPNNEVNWSSSQVEVPQINHAHEASAYSYRPKTLNFQGMSEVDYDPAAAAAIASNKNALPTIQSEGEKSNIETDDEDEIMEVQDEVEEKMKVVFGLSCGSVTNDSKAELQEKIRMLGIEESETDFTHLIITKLVRSSKFFSALASGRTILHSDYLDECIKHNQLVDMDEYEVGNPQFKCTFRGNKDQLLLNGPYRCRMLVERNFDKFKNGLFTDKKFLMICKSDRQAIIEDVIKAGGGNVVDVSIVPSVLKRANIFICLVDDAKQLSKKDLTTLKDCKIDVQSTKFIYDYLLTEKIINQHS